MGAVPIEVNLRMGGDHVYEFIKLAWGICLIESAAKIATRNPLTIEKPTSPFVYLQGKYFEPNQSGVITLISYPEEFHLDPHISNLHFDFKVGDKVEVPPKGFDFLGWITIQASTQARAQEYLAKIYPKIKYVIKTI